MIDNTCVHFDCWHETGATISDWCLLKGKLNCDNCKDYERNSEEE